MNIVVLKDSFTYFLSGVLTGVLVMWIAPESRVYISEDQLEEMSIKVSENIRNKEIGNTNVDSRYEWMVNENNNADLNSKLADGFKEDIKKVIANELRAYKEQMRGENRANKIASGDTSDREYEQYYEAQSILYDAVNGAPISFQQFNSDTRVKSLPVDLRNKLMGEVAMKLSSGELNRDSFLGNQ